ncbi:MAG: sigma-54 dependent transcriptional regulator [Deltaproteobacteria bacterium]|nr:sigma-54 dependent transcriptional regulator [Deltaproteobacteria bacterium]
MAKILIIDDDVVVTELLSHLIKEQGHEATCAHTLAAGIDRAKSGDFAVVFLDVLLPDGSGLEALPDIRDVSSSPEVIIMTGTGDPDGAELAIKSGAWDYIEKTSSINTMVLPLVRALEYREIKLTQKPLGTLKRQGIVGNSPPLKTCLEKVAQAAVTEASVLITGETGTGKELFAWAIHENSRRADRNFVVVDCATLSDTLVESVLFGYAKGAFTGADRAREGLINQADGGTLFLDEIGELPLGVQRAFLRVLQERRFRPLGSKEEQTSHFRLVAATNRNLDQMVREGHFRSDLLYRIRSFAIELPPLRERPEDIPALVTYHLGRLAERHGSTLRGFSPEFFEALIAYDWPGNVRELVNALERVLAEAGQDATLFPKNLPPHIRVKMARSSIGGKTPLRQAAPAAETPLPPVPPRAALPRLQELRDEAIARVERQYIVDLLAACGENIKKAMEISGLSRSRLYELIKKYQASSV